MRADRARRSEEEGRLSLLVEKREKHSFISTSVEAVIPCSFARADCRGFFSFVDSEAAGRRFGGYTSHTSAIFNRSASTEADLPLTIGGITKTNGS